MAPFTPSRLLHESGLPTLWRTGPDALLIILSRTLRMSAYGSTSLLLALLLSRLSIPDPLIGLFMTLTLIGDLFLSLLLTQIADRVGRRRTLIFGSFLMILSGAVFATCSNYWILLLAAVVGVISATGGDFGPFRAIEESVLAELTGVEERADVLGWYVTLASLGSAGGMWVAGRAVEGLREGGWGEVESYRVVFWGYCGMGAVNAVVGGLLSDRCELRGVKKGEGQREGGTAEESRLLEGNETGGDGEVVREVVEKKRTWFTEISNETLSVMAVLWFLLSVDSVADGMVSMSLTTYYIDQKFHPTKSTLGDFLSTAYLLAALSTIFSGPLVRYIGLINTMVFTHIPSSAAVLLFPFPKSLNGTFALLLLRVGLNNMDQAPRAALISAVVKPEERTAVMGITVLFRTLASVTGPTVTGFLAANNRFWVAFVAAGALRLAYDLGLFTMFINIKFHKHEVAPVSVPREDSEQGLDEEAVTERMGS